MATNNAPPKNKEQDRSVILDILGGLTLAVGILSFLSGRENGNLQAFVQESANRMARLATALVGGQISVLEFQAAMTNEITQLHNGVAMIIFGLRVPPQAQAAVNRIIAQQVQYLNNWVAQIQAQGIAPDDLARIRARAISYTNAYRETAAILGNITIGLPEMPFYPAQLTRCHNNCRCEWVYRRLPGPGNYDCYYQLGEVEHCPTCLRRNQVAWPLQVRGGVIVDAQKYLAPRFFYTGK